MISLGEGLCGLLLNRGAACVISRSHLAVGGAVRTLLLVTNRITGHDRKESKGHERKENLRDYGLRLPGDGLRGQ